MSRFPASSLIILPYTRARLPGYGRLMRFFRVTGKGLGDTWADAPQRSMRCRRHAMRMELDLRDWSQRRTYFIGSYHEPDTQIALGALLEPGDRFIDVGANVGMVTLIAAATVGEGGSVEAIEPNPECIPKIRRLIEMNGLSQVRIHPVCLSDTDGEFSLLVPGSDTEKGHIGDFGSADEGSSETRVQAVRGDALFAADQRPISFIKMDVEGHEPHAIRGLRRTIERDKPILFTEINSKWLARAGSSPMEMIELMESLGYEGFSISVRMRRLELTKVDSRRSEWDENALWRHPAQPRGQIFERWM